MNRGEKSPRGLLAQVDVEPLGGWGIWAGLPARISRIAIAPVPEAKTGR